MTLRCLPLPSQAHCARGEEAEWACSHASPPYPPLVGRAMPDDNRSADERAADLLCRLSALLAYFLLCVSTTSLGIALAATKVLIARRGPAAFL